VEELETRNPYKLSVQYDPQYGYPTDLYVDYSAEVIDDEVGIATSGLSF
jgi:hypothetical protein